MKNIIGDMGRLVFVSLLLVGLLGSWRVGGFPAEDLVARLPGQPDVGFKQFAGYVDVDVKAGRSLFYYFAEAEADADNKPLTLWLNGGPGCSSVGGGAFTELGPFFPRGDGRGLLINSNSWNKVSNLLFVESPAGVGWSYSNTTSDYTTGDAAAGHYIPQLAEVLLNHKYSNGLKFNIKGVAIGNPLLRLDRDIPAVYEYFWSHGMISDEIYLTVTDRCEFDDYSFGGSHSQTDSCNNAISDANLIVGQYTNYLDVIQDICYPSIVQQELTLKKYATKMSIGVDVCMSFERQFYFNLPEVQQALHANRTSLPYSWSMCSEYVISQSHKQTLSSSSD
ncbi:Serine carboxypeptidase-like 42 [Acorus calamus]|uniref:Serine carboxypeptidase-like 42 n=1 Tax=Acorus calamus TaxID=4465 RepID=A0AAV9CIM9_ACOCL|nr:Serine carboxypeptidase-like 42 [Acorus calamus]